MGNENSRNSESPIARRRNSLPIKSFQNGQARPLTFRDLLCSKCCLKNQFTVTGQEEEMMMTARG